MNEVINLSEYSDDELLSIVEAIKKETVKRTVSDFPHKVGDCFFRVAPSSMGRGLMVCKIVGLDDAIECRIINIDACNNSWESTTYYTYAEFTRDWKTPISPSVFELHKEKNKKIHALNLEFVNQVIALKNEVN